MNRAIRFSPKDLANHITLRVFTQSGPIAEVSLIAQGLLTQTVSSMVALGF